MLRHRISESYFWILAWFILAIALLLIADRLTQAATLIAM